MHDRSSPSHADVLIVGAGPAGSAAAIRLSRAGLNVVLTDRASTFPRDKVCGDALIPDALAAIADLGLTEAVTQRARMLQGVRIYAPDQRLVTVRSACACLPRREFDDILRRAAIESGARFAGGLTAERPVFADGDNGAVVGVAFTDVHRRPIELRAPITLLATGASAGPLVRFGVCERTAASATAARLYVQADEQFARDFDYLCISFDRAICPGYGWIFPAPDGVFNLGIGFFNDARRPLPERNVRRLLQRFADSFPPAVALLRHARVLTPLKGALLRTTLCGARLNAPGLLVIGEAAGTTYALTGEGIGKAMASGLLAARSIIESGDPSTAGVRYEAAMHGSFDGRFAAYHRAQRWLTSATLANLLAWRAARSRFVNAQFEGMFQETADPRDLFSIFGLVRAFVS